jgi:hypothetical protein
MAFDPDKFLTGKEGDATAGFDPDKFISSPSTSAEPAMVANIQVGPGTPGTPMETPPVPGGTSVPVPGTDYQIPFQPPVVNAMPVPSPYNVQSLQGPGLMSQLGETALGQEAAAMAANAGKIAQPFATAASKTVGSYITQPLAKLGPDLAAVAMGVPPPYATSQAIGATQGAFNIARQTPTPVSTGPVAPTAQQVAGNPMLAEMAQRQMAAEAETLANRTMIQKIAMSKVMQMAAPALNTAARVAGPAGLAYNAYQAGQMAQETQLGPRLAAGQGGAAEQAFRNMNVQYGTGSSPAGRPGFNESITADQARNILASKSARDIQAFGGTDFLRKKALGQ